MSNRKIAMLVVGALIFGVIFFFYNQQAQKQEEAVAMILGYDQKTFLEEGGYTAARNYADSIFTELYCNTEEIVYQYAFTEYGLDIPHRELYAAVMITSPTENHCYLEYRIPNVEQTKGEDGHPTDQWQYTGKYTYALMDLRNIERHGVANYSCSDFSIIDKDINKVLEKALDTNEEKIEPDDQRRWMIDYGVLFNHDETLAESMANREKERITGYLLAQQQENAADYQFSSSASENGVQGVSANTTDYTETIQAVSTPTPSVAVDKEEYVTQTDTERYWTGGAASGDGQQVTPQASVEEGATIIEEVPDAPQEGQPEEQPAEVAEPAEPTEEPRPTVSQSFRPRAAE